MEVQSGDLINRKDAKPIGTILGTPQWLMLRRHVQRAVWWIPANVLAWVPGMVLAFYGADIIFSVGIGMTTIVLAIGTLVAIGAVVGAIHGLALVWLVHSQRPRQRGKHAMIQG